MSTTASPPVSHPFAAEHRRAFHVLAGPIHRHGIKLRPLAPLGGRFGVDGGERLLLAYLAPSAHIGPTLIELELRLPHPDPALSAPRLIFRLKSRETTLGTVTIAYVELGRWAMSLHDAAPFAAFMADSDQPVWEDLEAMKSLDRNAVSEIVSELVRFCANIDDRRVPADNSRSYADDLAKYWQLRSLLQAEGISVQRHTSGQSVHHQPGRFLRSPTRKNSRAVVILEVTKPKRHGKFRLTPRLMLHMGRTNPELFSMTIYRISRNRWSVFVEVRATSEDDLAFVKGLRVEAGQSYADTLNIDAVVRRMLFLYRIVTTVGRHAPKSAR